MTYRPDVDVHLILEHPDGQVLLAERANTGYADGLVNAPGGKLEDGEDVRAAAIREAREEIGVDVDPDHARCVAVIHHRAPGRRSTGGLLLRHLNLAGRTQKRRAAQVRRPHLGRPRQPAPHTIAYGAAGLRAYRSGQPFALDGWNTDAPAGLAIGG